MEENDFEEREKVTFMYIVTSAEMRTLDEYTIHTVGIPAAVLMENAGRAVAEEVAKLSSELGANKPWLILVGKGNNGGDGIVAVRHLRELGVEAELLYAAEPAKLTSDAALQRDIAARLGIAASVYGMGNIQWERYSGIVDALLGTGTAGAPREPYASIIRKANASGLPVVAIDIPSGLDADTGDVSDPCIRADTTVTLAFLKCGLTQYPGAEQAGKVVVRSIGIPEELAEQQEIRTFWTNEELFLRRFELKLPLARKADTHKGTYGHVLVAAGTRQYSGAGLLAAAAALRSGAGLVSWALPERLLDPMIGRIPEAMLHGMPDDGRGDWAAVPPEAVLRLAAGKKALAIGPGMSRFAGDGAWLRDIWSGAPCPLVVDADALNMIADAGGLDAWPQRDSAAILTPHPGEMARLTGLTAREVLRDRIGLARRYAVQHGVTLVLKGARTVTATPAGDVYVNTSGNPGMATGGAGDALAGLIAGLLAQGFDAGLAAALGVYLHGLAGDCAAASRPSLGSLIAGDIIDCL